MTSERFSSRIFLTSLHRMAGLNEPKNETVRIDLPLPTSGKARDQDRKETVRIQLPLRETVGKAPLHAPTELQSATESSARDVASSEFSPPAKPVSFSTPSSASEMPAPASLSSELKKETVRIPPIPDAVPSTDEIKNTE